MKKILIVDNLHPYLKNELEQDGFVCDVNTSITKAEAEKCIGEYIGLVIRSKFKIDKLFIDKCSNLKWIARAGAGMENIDLQYAHKKGIVCLNSPEGNSDAVAEHSIAMLLSLFNKILKADKEIRNGVWDRDGNWGTTLQGKTVGIIGFGYMGEAFSKRLSGFDVEVLAQDKYKTGFSNNLVKETSLKNIYAECDIISLHIPLTEETKYLVNKDFISKMKKPFYLINTSRGQNVKTDDLVEGIINGKVLGACLDVIEYESLDFEKLTKENTPNSFSYLINSDKVILSPHIAGWTNEAYKKHSEVLIEKIRIVIS